MQPEQAIEHVLSVANQRGMGDVDVLAERGESKVDQSTSLGLGVRVLSNGRTGLAYTERLEARALERILDEAQENAELQDPLDVFLPDKPDALPEAPLRLYNAELENLSFEELAEVGLEIEATAKETDSRVMSLPYLGVSRNVGEWFLGSTKGVRYQQRENAVTTYCAALLQEGEQRKTGMRFWQLRDWDRAGAAAVGTLAVKEAQGLLGAKSIPNCKIPVILDEYCAPRLLGMYFRAFYAEAAQKGTSRLAGKLGETIAGSNVTLFDDPFVVGGEGSCHVDAEGVVTEKLPLVEGGVFRNFLYHIESARKEERLSNGHARRSYNSGISTAYHNLVMEPGAYSLEELCQQPERALLVTSLEGAAGCNPVSGDISIGVQGFLLEHGQRVQAVDSITIAGNFFELLQKIQGIGNACQPFLTNVFIPPLLVDGFAISG
jgi:PmbA protein